MSFFYGLVCFPASRFLSYFWNLGSLLGFLLSFQVFTGLLLVLYYTPDASLAFDSVQYICREVNSGWLIRILHFNGASFIFSMLYLHIFKALFFFSYRLSFVWLSGVSLLFLIMGVAFTGYVLVWSQISYWAAVVITSLLSSIPFFGSSFLLWVWGGYGVCSSTLKFFFMLHFLLPFIVLLTSLIHLFFLHEKGSTSFLGYSGSLFKVYFFPYYVVKDLLNLIPLTFMFLFLLSFPYFLGDPEMFEIANPLVSPVHIVPEWYFLVFYAILRSIPFKSLGVFFMLFSLLLLYFFIFIDNYLPPFSGVLRFLASSFICNFVFLSWVGQCNLEFPYLLLGQISLLIYFLLLGSILSVSYISGCLFSPVVSCFSINN